MALAVILVAAPSSRFRRCSIVSSISNSNSSITIMPVRSISCLHQCCLPPLQLLLLRCTAPQAMLRTATTAAAQVQVAAVVLFLAVTRPRIKSLPSATATRLLHRMPCMQPRRSIGSLQSRTSTTSEQSSGLSMRISDRTAALVVRRPRTLLLHHGTTAVVAVKGQSAGAAVWGIRALLRLRLHLRLLVRALQGALLHRLLLLLLQPQAHLTYHH